MSTLATDILHKVTIIALQNDQIEVVKSSMLGSILSNLLLVMGMCFFLGGVFNMGESGAGTEQVFASGTAQTACSLMTLSSASMVIPAALAMVMENGKNQQSAKESILILSRGTAIILLLLYILYLFFQLRTHKNLFNPDPPADSGEAGQNGEEEEEEETAMSAWSAAAVLVGVTLIISFCADYLVDSIDDIVATGKISKNFIGLILIPIVGNAAEHVTACVVAIRDKMDLVSFFLFDAQAREHHADTCAGYGRRSRIERADRSSRDTLPCAPGLGHGQRYGPPV